MKKEKSDSKVPRKAKEKSEKIIQKKEKTQKEEPQRNPGEPDLTIKKKLVLKLKQQEKWKDSTLKECQEALEKVNWDYNALFIPKRRKKKVEEPIQETIEDSSEPTPIIVVDHNKEKKEYVQGLDPEYIKNYRSDWKPNDMMILAQVNKKLGTDYKTWTDLSEHHEELTEEFLTQYENYINWYAMFKTHNPDNYSAKFKKKMHDHFLITNLDLVPRNYKRKRDEGIIVSEED